MDEGKKMGTDVTTEKSKLESYLIAKWNILCLSVLLKSCLQGKMCIEREVPQPIAQKDAVHKKKVDLDKWDVVIMSAGRNDLEYWIQHDRQQCRKTKLNNLIEISSLI